MSIITNQKNVYGNIANFFKMHSYDFSTKTAEHQCNLLIPDYQREYVWTQHTAKKLWEDLVECMDSKRGINSHFTGNIFLYKPKQDDNTMYIVDGQQRITSIMLILYAIKGCCYLYSKSITNITLKDTYSQLIDKINYLASKFKTNNMNSQFFHDYVIVRDNNTTLIDNNTGKKVFESYSSMGMMSLNKNLKNAYDFFYNTIHEYTEDYRRKSKTPDADTQNILEKIYLHATNNLELVFLICDEEQAVYRVFESLNNRGKALDPIDLIKNEIFKGKTNPLTITRWNEMRINFDNNNNFQNYVLYYLSVMIHKQIIRRERLYETLLIYFEDKTLSIDDFVNKLHMIHGLYLFFNGNQKKSTSFKTESMKYLAEEYHVGKYIAPNYVLIPCFSKFLEPHSKLKEKDIFKIASLCFNIMYRYKSIINAQGSAKALEELMLNTGKMFEEFDTKYSLNDILKNLSDFALAKADDGKFEKALENYSDKNGAHAIPYALLRRIAAYPDPSVTPSTKTYNFANYKRKNATLEHILPVKHQATPSWATAFGSANKCDEYVNRLGNYCLLEQDINSVIKNFSYTDKLSHTTKKGTTGYTTSTHTTLSGARYIAKTYTKWTPTEIDKRQKELAAKAPTYFPIEVTKLFDCSN